MSDDGKNGPQPEPIDILVDEYAREQGAPTEPHELAAAVMGCLSDIQRALAEEMVLRVAANGPGADDETRTHWAACRAAIVGGISTAGGLLTYLLHKLGVPSVSYAVQRRIHELRAEERASAEAQKNPSAGMELVSTHIGAYGGNVVVAIGDAQVMFTPDQAEVYGKALRAAIDNAGKQGGRVMH